MHLEQSPRCPIAPKNSGVGQSISKVEQINLKSANWLIEKLMKIKLWKMWHADTKAISH